MDTVPKAIAGILSIQRTTFYRHLATIRQNYNVHSTIELMMTICEKNKDVNMDCIKLTPRGKDIFTLILEGKKISDIAQELCISYSGVLRNREKMLFQNDCHSMTELIAKYHDSCQKESSEILSCAEI